MSEAPRAEMNVPLKHRPDRRTGKLCLATSVIIVAMTAVSARAETATEATGAGACDGAVKNERAPAWAQFAAPRSATPYIVGRGGRIIAFLFTQPVRAGNQTRPHNKILWVIAGANRNRTLRLQAQLVNSRTIEHRRYRSVDPSGRIFPTYLNLPAAGCWSLAATWDGQAAHAVIRVVGAHG
jgi:hypothetical protein